MAAGKAFVKPNQPTKPTRAALGDLRNKEFNIFCLLMENRPLSLSS